MSHTKIKQALSNSILISMLILFCGIRESYVSAQTEEVALRNSVVKVFVHAQPPDFFKPWQSRESESRSGSGSIIEGNRILTSAHVVQHHTFLQVKKHMDSRKYTATVEAIGHDCDLALLKVEDPKFFENTRPIPLGDLPLLKDSVTVMGYPVGGEQLSVTEGVVSRIDMIPYAAGLKALLAVQIDAALNPGNSGGPVLQDGKLIGVAFQILPEGENIGYAVPVPVIVHFFQDLRDGKYDGFPTLAIAANKTENQDLRQYYELPAESGGVIITEVVRGGPGDGKLEKGDILTEIEGVRVAEDGTVNFRNHERILFTYLFNQKQIGDSLAVKVIRKGKEKTFPVTLAPYRELVPPPFYFTAPTYYIYGGMVFSVLSGDLMQNWKLSEATFHILDFYYYYLGSGRLKRDQRTEIVILLHVLPDEFNAGYHEAGFQIISKINGESVSSFKDLVRILEENENPFTIIETEEYSHFVLNHRGAREANSRISKTYHIQSPFSDDVAEWLKGA